MKPLRLLFLRLRAFSLEAQIETGESLILDHRRRLRAAQTELRRVRSQIALLTPARKLLDEALSGKR